MELYQEPQKGPGTPDRRLLQLVMINGNFQILLNSLGDLVDNKQETVVIDRTSVFFWSRWTTPVLMEVLQDIEQLSGFNWILLDVTPEGGAAHIATHLDEEYSRKFQSIDPLIQHNWTVMPRRAGAQTIDDVLDKISESGISSLSHEEQEVLKNIDS